MDFNRILAGMIRAARLDKTFFEEVEHDTTYSQDALIVVILVSLLGALGGFISSLGAGFGSAILTFVISAAMSVGGYYLWVFVAQLVGTRLFKGTGDFGEVQRALGFAYAPQVLNLLKFIPCLGGIIAFAAWIWSMAAGYVAIKQSLDQDDTNAILTIVVSGLIVIAITVIVGAIFAALGFAGVALTSAISG